ncbi:MAG: tetratricopeptide repeat protein [Gammaproteobacteria bacterium]|nr:tetratricopeptide repeat protein [Gammaproteobacteria bacterium]
MTIEIEHLFDKAYKLQFEGQLPQAISLYEHILSSAPKHFDTLHFLGLTYAQLGNMNNAILYLLQAHAVNPQDPGLLNNLANAYKKSNQLDKAIHYYLQAIQLKPEYAQAHNNLATVYAIQNEYQSALIHYGKAVNAEPDFSAAHFNLGLLLLQNNQLNAAKTQFNNVISLNPEHSEAHFYLGVLYLEDNMLAEAEHAFHNVLERDSEQVQTLINLGVIALKKEQNQIAVDYFTKALALDNEDIDARNNLAATFMHHDRFENALMHYDVLLKKDPENIEYLYNSGVAQMALGHLNEATIFFEQILNLQPNHCPTLNNMAALYLKMDMRETSREYLQRALAINPQDKISKHMLNALSGATDASTTPDYAKNLFNNYALYYDQHMKGQLNYSIPQHLGRTLHQLELIQVNRTLDIGCGTGLSGIVLREISKHLTGIDIAEKMLGHAKEKGIYDSLIHSEVSDFLSKNKQAYDLIVAADVLPYFGDLTALFQSISAHMTPEGYFIFTTEISETESWILQTSARFKHSSDYIKTLANQFQFNMIKQEQVPARLQNQHPLDVMLYVLKKTAPN